MKNFFYFLFESSTFRQPQDYQFNSHNRKQLHTHLTSLKGEGMSHEVFLNHYRRMNMFCDKEHVALTDDELQFFKSSLKPGINIPIGELLEEENRMFKKNSDQFSGNKNDLNFILRNDRPSFFAWFPKFAGTLKILNDDRKKN